MSTKYNKIELSAGPIKNESTQRRWEMFHRAIAHAKQSNNETQLEKETGVGDLEKSGPLLSVVR